MLLASTSCPSLPHCTVQAKRAQVAASLVAARACSPSLLTIVIESVITLDSAQVTVQQLHLVKLLLESLVELGCNKN